MSFRLFVGVGAIAIVTPVAVGAQNDSGDPGRNWAAIVDCGSIDATEQRHQCLDDVLRRAGVLSEARVAQAAREEFGRENRSELPRAVPAPETRPPAAVAPVTAAATPTPTRPVDIDEVVTTIASVREVGYRRLVVTTAEGSVWGQTQAETFTSNPKVGDTFTIQRAAMGSYRCQFGRASRYRCERAD